MNGHPTETSAGPTGPTPIKVCLCGSTRWPNEFVSATESETRAGKIVLSVGLYGHLQGIDMDGDTKKSLDNLHLHKIIESDEILVLNRPVVECLDCGYLDDKLFAVECHSCRSGRLRRHNRIGESTAREIAFARSISRRVRFRYENGDEFMKMFECDVHQLVSFKSGAMYRFSRTILLPAPPVQDVIYRGLVPGPTDEGEEFIRITFDISKQRYLCELETDKVEDGHDLAAVIRFYGPEWTHSEVPCWEPV